MASNLLQMLFGQGTEPTYAGLRMPKQRMGDDARLIRLGNPQETFRRGRGMVDAAMGDDITALPPLTADQRAEIEGGFMEAPNSRKENSAKRDAAVKGAVGGIGDMLSQAFTEQPRPQLNFPQLQMGQNIPIIDPRYLRYAGGRKKGGAVKPGTFVDVHDDEKVVNYGDGDVEVLPKLTDEQQKQIQGAPLTIDAMLRPNDEVEGVELVEQSPADMLRGRIESIQRKDYSNIRNEDGTRSYGKDFDKKRDWKDALRSAGLGILQSLASAPANADLGSMLGRAIGGGAAGGVMGATMDNVDNKMMDQFKLAQLLPQYENAANIDKNELEKKYRQAQVEATQQKPIIDRYKADTAALKAERDYQIKVATLDWKKEDRDRYYELEEIKRVAREKNDERNYRLADRKQKEIERNNKIIDENRDLDRTSREKVAGMSQAGQDRRTQLTIDARRTLAEYEAAQKAGLLDKANEAREKLARLKAELDGQQ